MTTEQARVLEALQTAIQMELDGRQCYLGAAEGSGNVAGRNLLLSLAAEENEHRQRFATIYSSLQSKKGWPKLHARKGAAYGLRASFLASCRTAGANVAAGDNELGAIKTAIDKENEGYDFYMRQSRNASFTAEKEFYDDLAAEESEHRLLLLDYLEYLRNPAAWFTEKEHPSLEG